MLNVYRFCFVVLVALTVLLAVRERRNVAQARAEGYAAAVDSVRAVGDSLSHIEPRTAPLKWYADTCVVWRTR